MILSNRLALTFVALGLGTSLSCAKSSFDRVSGTVSVDGQPVDAGTVSMRPVDEQAGGPAGGKIENGRFEVAARDGLAVGKYTVLVQAAKKTGRKIKDPQRGEVDEFASLALADSPKEVNLTTANAENLELSFNTASK